MRNLRGDTMTPLLHTRCQPVTGDPLSETEILRQLQEVSGWQLHEGAIERTFTFRNWLETLAFVNALGWLCHTEDHHPDVSLSYDRCVVRFRTHSVGGVSLNDFICAAKVNTLVAFAA
jgi:4a-hydroxytetrahydrobiopterin dehydratase